jgi:hypothetical protein
MTLRTEIASSQRGLLDWCRETALGTAKFSFWHRDCVPSWLDSGLVRWRGMEFSVGFPLVSSLVRFFWPLARFAGFRLVLHRE